MPRFCFVSQIAAVSAEDWNRLLSGAQPFLRHEFLHALEATGCVSADTGWQPHHMLAYDDQKQLIAALPLYLKDHSYGEFVFDWAWANAYQRYGFDYYPKLVSGIPFTPVWGQRLLSRQPLDQSLMTLCHQALQQALTQSQASSLHILFNSAQESEHWQQQQALTRTGYQYFWHNQDYQHFDDFLANLTSRKRKSINKERRALQAQGVSFCHHRGGEITPDLWQQFYSSYQRTYLEHGQRGYLSLAFFLQIGQQLPEHTLLITAYQEQQPIGFALCLYDDSTLYGRYWGCLRKLPFLHFEACYYQGIEFCIQQGLTRFEPGAQGEHKMLRGFVPSKTYSSHWISHPGFRQAIADFIKQENNALDDYHENAEQILLPYKQQSG